MTDNELRKLILDDLSRIRKLLITCHSINVINWIKKMKNVRSSDLVGKYDISIQNASERLKRLYRQGYLTREEVTADSGGIEFIYRCEL